MVAIFVRVLITFFRRCYKVHVGLTGVCKIQVDHAIISSRRSAPILGKGFRGFQILSTVVASGYFVFSFGLKKLQIKFIIFLYFF